MKRLILCLSIFVFISGAETYSQQKPTTEILHDERTLHVYYENHRMNNSTFMLELPPDYGYVPKGDPIHGVSLSDGIGIVLLFAGCYLLWLLVRRPSSASKQSDNSGREK